MPEDDILDPHELGSDDDSYRSGPDEPPYEKGASGLDDEEEERKARRFERNQSMWDLAYYGYTLGFLGLYTVIGVLLLFAAQYLVPYFWNTYSPWPIDVDGSGWRISVLAITSTITGGWATTRIISAIVNSRRRPNSRRRAR